MSGTRNIQCHLTASESALPHRQSGFGPLRAILILAMIVLSASVASAQLSQGGEPWKWGSPMNMSDIPVITTGELDLTVLAAEDAVTDGLHGHPLDGHQVLGPWRSQSKRSSHEAEGIFFKDLRRHHIL